MNFYLNNGTFLDDNVLICLTFQPSTKLSHLVVFVSEIYYMAKELLRPSQFRAVQLIPREEELQISDELQNELAALYAEEALDQYKPEAIVEGKIMSITPDNVIVDIGYKSNGAIPLYEFTSSELKALKEEDSIEVLIDELENINGNVVLSYEKAKAAKAWKAVMKLFEDEKPVEGVVTAKVKGGLSVDIGIPAFLPGSQVDVQRVTDFDQYVGQNIKGYILKVNRKRGNVIISRRKYLGEQRSEGRKKILEGLEINQTIQGTVKNITNYGVFIDIGGVDGLLHITDMTWGRISHPSEIVNIGDSVTVKVISFDKENEKISLGMKQLTENPWESLDASVKEGAVIKGTISSITDYGLFVKVASGVEGLVHISEVSWTQRISDLRNHFKVAQEIEVLVVSLDKDHRRMSLSVKQLDKNPWEAITENYSVGETIKGKVTNIADFGIFVQIVPGIDGLVHISDLSWTEHIKHPEELFKIGDEVDAVITDINTDKKKISLGIKQLSENPWENLEEKYPVGSLVKGKVSKLTDFGAFIKLESGIEGLVHISEFPKEGEGQTMQDILQVGNEREFRITKVNQEEHKLGLSTHLEAPAPSERKTAPKKKTTKKAATTAKTTTKTNSPRVKSSLQLELEKLAESAQKDEE